jgi:hypothetical protein
MVNIGNSMFIHKIFGQKVLTHTQLEILKVPSMWKLYVAYLCFGFLNKSVNPMAGTKKWMIATW